VVVSYPDHRQAFKVCKQGSSLGDPLAIPVSQNFRTFVRKSSTRGLEAFIELARGYVFQDADRKAVYTINAEVYFYFFVV
jgi:hypothetical protein